MNRPSLLAFIAIAVAGVLTLLFLYPHQMIAPGPLLAGHASLEPDCFACHAPGQGASSERCVACHVPAEIGIKTSKGVPIRKSTKMVAFHGQLQEQDCMACHSDHAGPLLARKGNLRFDHQLLKPSLQDRCASCHKRPDDSLHRQGAENCAQCHSTKGWKPATFDHDKFFKLDRDHDAPCATCHVGNDFKRYTCYGCHEHTPENVAAEHREEGIRNIDNCVRCHRSADDGEGGEGGREEGREGRGEEGDDD